LPGAESAESPEYPAAIRRLVRGFQDRPVHIEQPAVESASQAAVFQPPESMIGAAIRWLRLVWPPAWAIALLVLFVGLLEWLHFWVRPVAPYEAVMFLRLRDFLIAGALAWLVFGALAYAIVPEIVFRTTMMAPTALDLAVLPFLLLVVLEIGKGATRWAILAVPVALYLVFAHPWLFGILAAVGAIYLLLRIVLPLRGDEPQLSGLGAAWLIAILAGGVAHAHPGCRRVSGPRRGELLAAPHGRQRVC
jgi:hypothetical protein